MSCLAHDGASYHESPTRTSSLPSLLTSATETPSERNLPSMVVFFQETEVPLSSPAAPTVIRSIADQPRTAIVRFFMRMGEKSPIRREVRAGPREKVHDTNLLW